MYVQFGPFLRRMIWHLLLPSLCYLRLILLTRMSPGGVRNDMLDILLAEHSMPVAMQTAPVPSNHNSAILTVLTNGNSIMVADLAI